MRISFISRTAATLVLAFAFAILSAKADSIHFNFTPDPGPNSGLGFSFAISSAAPSIALADDGFLYGNVLITLSNGFPYTSLVLFENNASLLDPQGFDLTFQQPLLPGFNIDYIGPNLFTGTVSPSFLSGTYHVTGTTTPSGTLTFAATPEPSSIALLGTGALAFVGTLRRRLTRRA